MANRRRDRIYLAPGANAIPVADRIAATLADLKTRFPEDLDYGLVFDTTVFVKDTIQEVIHTLVEAFVLVPIVVFVFLGKLRDDADPADRGAGFDHRHLRRMLAIGYTANTVSLLALVLAIGIVVDDAIVVIENVERVMEEEPELSVKEATRKAMGEITAPIVAITLVLLSVFVPGCLHPRHHRRALPPVRDRRLGLDADLGDQRPLAAPALCSILLTQSHGRPRGPVGWMLAGIDKMTARLCLVVRRLVRVSIVCLVVLAGVFSFIGVIFKATPQGFLPEEDQGAIFAIVQLPEGASQNRTAATATQIDEIIRREPAVESVTAVDRLRLHQRHRLLQQGFFIVRLKPFEERDGADATAPQP